MSKVLHFKKRRRMRTSINKRIGMIRYILVHRSDPYTGELVTGTSRWKAQAIAYTDSKTESLKNATVLGSTQGTTLSNTLFTLNEKLRKSQLAFARIENRVESVKLLERKLEKRRYKFTLLKARAAHTLYVKEDSPVRGRASVALERDTQLKAYNDLVNSNITIDELKERI